MARPRKEINQEAFEGLCAIQCTKQEICVFLRITDKTLESWCKRTYGAGFSEVFRQKRRIGNISLRRAQFRLAEKSATMGIWLGKQYLGQKDVRDYNINANIDESAKEISDYLAECETDEDFDSTEE